MLLCLPSILFPAYTWAWIINIHYSKLTYLNICQFLFVIIINFLSCKICCFFFYLKWFIVYTFVAICVPSLEVSVWFIQKFESYKCSNNWSTSNHSKKGSDFKSLKPQKVQIVQMIADFKSWQLSILILVKIFT